MEIDHLSDKLRSYCNRMQKKINDNGDAHSKVYNEAYYGLLSASNALHTLRKAGMTVSPMPLDGGDLLYRFASPRINTLVQEADEDERAGLTSAWLDIQSELCDLAGVITAADRMGYTLFEK
jgi:hypothetical protein